MTGRLHLPPFKGCRVHVGPLRFPCQLDDLDPACYVIPWTHVSLRLNGISIGFAVFVVLTVVTNIQTNRPRTLQRTKQCSPLAAMRAKNQTMQRCIAGSAPGTPCVMDSSRTRHSENDSAGRHPADDDAMTSLAATVSTCLHVAHHV